MSAVAVQAWKCGVCGYVHHGLQPPDWCPICGAAREEFEPYLEPAPVASQASQAVAWRCTVCGYLHEGSDPPDECPVCGAPADAFEPAAGVATTVAGAARAVRVVIVGAGIAGVSAAESLRSAAPGAAVTLVSREAHLPYYRLNLTRLLAGEVGQHDLPIHPQSWYDERGIRLLLGVEAKGLDAENRVLELRGADPEPFDVAILASGSHAFVPPIPGADKAGVFSLRTVDDARHLLEWAPTGARCLCVGGGILGLETAGALARQGAQPVLLEGFGWLLPRQLNRRAGDLLAERVSDIGIGVRCGVKVAEILGDDRVRGVRLEGGEDLAADVVVVAAGVRANTSIARAAGLQVNAGVVVDDFLTTSHPAVLAAGDVAEHRGVMYGIWPAAKYQGNIAGLNAAGVRTEFGGIPRSNTLKVLGIDLFSIGQVEATDGSYHAVEGRTGDRFLRFVFRDGKMVGAILLGDTALTSAVKAAVENKTNFNTLLAHQPGAADVSAHLANK